MRDVASRLAWLATCAPAELGAEWVRLKGGVAPAVPPTLLRQLVAYAIQEKRWRGLPVAVARELDRSAYETSGEGRSRGTPGTPVAVRAGTRFVRSWQGRTISVEAIEDGFLWEDRRYASLSQIAREVTGARWSGPRFFGLPPRG
jgi:hypothetical protein